MKYRNILLLLTFSLLFTSLQYAQDTLTIQSIEEGVELSIVDENDHQKYLAAYTNARQMNKEEELAKLLPVLAAYELNLGNSTGALRYLLEELDLLKKAPQKDRRFENEVAIGDIYFNEKLFAEALPYYKRAKENLPLASGFQKTIVLEKLGETFAELLEPDSAFHFYAQLPVWGAATSDGFNGQLNTFHKIVQAYNKAGKYEEALQYNKRILERMQSENRATAEWFIIYNNLGYNYNLLQQYEQAIEHFKEAIKKAPASDGETLAILYTNIGIAHLNLNQFNLALIALKQAQTYLEKTDGANASQNNHLIARVYFKNNDLYNATNFNQLAIQFANDQQQPELLSEAYALATQIHIRLFEYETALDFYQKHLVLSDSLKQVERQKQQALLQGKLTLEKADKEIKLLLVNQEVKDLTIQQLHLEKEKQALALDKLTLEKDQQEQKLALLQRAQTIKETRIKNQELEAQRANQQLQITRQQLQAVEQEKVLAVLSQKEQSQRLAIEQQATKIREEAQKNQLLQQQNEINQLEIAQQESFRQLVYGVGSLGAVVLGLILAGLIYSRRINKKLAQQKEEIALEKSKSDALLLNILPAFTAQELKENGSATPRKYDNTTVLFADFVNFTGISEKMSPEELVAELNHCFQVFDSIMDKHGLEKIKTIGDAYMCVGGLPIPNNSHPQNAAKAAIEMMEFIQQRYQEKEATGETYWQMRIGLHSGPVVAGVVGTSKFAYDIWGDTVNTASRMESNSQAFKINLSGTTYSLLQKQFDCIYRGKIKAKNKGAIDMYFLEVH